MRGSSIAVALAALCAAGALVALSLAPPAAAWSPGNLPPGWTSTHTVDAAPGSPCPESYTLFGGGAVSPAFCTNSPTYQSDLDAFVDAHYTAPPTTTTSTSTPGATTTVVVTTATPAPTTTAAADPAAPPASAPAPATTTVVTVVTTATPLEQSLQAQLDALAAQISALTDRVTRLEKASDAAWLAYQQALEAGDSPADAAAVARGTALNVIYGLGDFAP